MSDAYASLDAALEEAKKLRLFLKKGKSRQVSSREERDLINATAMSWFKSHYFALKRYLVNGELETLTLLYKDLIMCSDKYTTRSKYDSILKEVSSELKANRGNLLSVDAEISEEVFSKNDSPPDFSNLVVDKKMREILIGRWEESHTCVLAGAPLAATVMMGGLLETLLLARFNKEENKSLIFSSKKAPINKSTGKTAPLQEWTLRSYIDVAHDLKWISHSAKNVGEVLRDYRNYVHPYKQLSHGMNLDTHDAELFWGVTKSISAQLIAKLQ